MSLISKNAFVSPKAKIGENVIIKDMVIVEDDVLIGDNVEIHYNAQIENGARIANNVKIFKGAVISCRPQDLKYKDEYTTLEIGESTVIREYATVSKGTKANKKTVVGKNCLLMNYVHIPHDSIVGDNVIMANAVTMGGHVVVEDWAIIGGLVGIHQFVRIGRHSFTAFSSRVTQDIPPYILAGGSPINYKGLNLVGLKRRGFDEEAIKHIKQASTYIYHSSYNISDAIKAIKDSVKPTDEVKHIIDFIEKSERGIIRK